MKRQSIFNIIAVLFLVSVFSVACTKKNSQVRLSPKLSTSQVLSVTSDSATVVGFVIAQGGGFQSKGVCYDTAANPTVDNNKVEYSGDNSKATFHVVLSGLQYATKYYARAFAITGTGPIYGEEYSFTTLPVAPTVTTDTIDSQTITGNSATGGGNVTVSGGAAVTARGICYSTDHNPTVSDNITSDGDGMGAFVSNLSDLKGNTTYYVRAYATNSAGTGYGQEVSFTTLVDIPKLTTAPVTNTTQTSAVSGGTITDFGGGTVTERGIVWSENADPTINDNKIVGTADTTYSDTITGLTVSTTYHVRAYAINSAGVGYGQDIQFSTFPTSLYMIGNGVADWDWSTTDLPMIPVNSHPNLFWKIVWMNATGGFKMNSAKAWNGNEFGKTGDATGNIDDAAGLVYAKGGDNIPVPGTAGYYMVVVDFATGKISISKPAVYLIGDVIGSWDTANPDGLFTVDNTNGVVTISKTLSNGDIRMYAWHPWFDQWWQSEFIILNGQIEFRGTGGDQTRVNVPAGANTVTLNFKTGAGSITQP